MTINLAELLSIIIAVFSVLGAIWRVAAIEKDIQITIRKVESKLDVFTTTYQEQREHQQYLINDLYGQIKHKSDRLMNEIKELETELRRLES